MRHLSILLTTILLSCCGLVSCDRVQERGIDQDRFREELAGREVTKVSPGAIMGGAMEMGEHYADICTEDLRIQLKAALAYQGLKKAANVCAELRLPVLDSLSTISKTVVTRPRELSTENSQQPSSLEEEILSAYRYNVEQALDLRPNVQISDDNLLFTRPIMLDESLCMRCHGAEASEEAKAIIRSYDPSRPAINYGHGDFLGMWSVFMPRKEVIRQL